MDARRLILFKPQLYIMNRYSLLILLCCMLSNIGITQDTFSIVAVDPETGEVGSAGASCVDLSNFNLPPGFLGELFPGEGAINTQAYYLSQNQANARVRMQSGDSPSEIIQWLVANDVQNNPSLRQYGVVRLIDGEGFSAAHTGSNTDPVKGDRTGDTYSIQGNILLGPEILDNMEDAFQNAEGDLAFKLMAAMQGANVPGADSRCLGNGTSSLFAFLKVAQPDDIFGQPSLDLGVSYGGNTTLEPIDSLQSLFNQIFPVSTEELSGISVQIYPNPGRDHVVFEVVGPTVVGTGSANNNYQLGVYDAAGRQVYRQDITENRTLLTNKQLGGGTLYIYKIQNPDGISVKSGKLIFQK